MIDRTTATRESSRQSWKSGDLHGRQDESMPQLWPMLRRNLLLIGTCVVLATVAGGALYMTQRPTYSSSARVLVQTDQLGTPSFLSGIAAYRESQYAEPVNRKIETEIALILSRTNAAKVIETLHVVPEDLPASPLKIVSRQMKVAYDKAIGKPERDPREGPSTELIDDFLSAISIEPVRSKSAETTSNVLDIKLDTARIDLSAQALQIILKAYLDAGAQQSQQLGQATMTRLSTQIGEVKTELSSIDKAIVDLSLRESSRGDLAAAATAAAAIQGGNRRDGTSVPNDAAVSQLVVQLQQLESQLSEQRASFTDQTESVVKLKQRVADARARLATHMRASATSSGEFSRLERQRMMAQEHYTELRRKLDQIDLFLQLTPAALNGRVVVDAPNVPSEAEVKRKKLIALAGPIAGLLLGLLLASLKEFSQQRVRTRNDVSRLLGLPLIGMLPKLPPQAVADLQRSYSVEAGGKL